MSHEHFEILPKVVLMTREVFESLPDASSSRIGILRKVLIGDRWHAVGPQEELGGRVASAQPIEIGAFVLED